MNVMLKHQMTVETPS